MARRTSGVLGALLAVVAMVCGVSLVSVAFVPAALPSGVSTVGSQMQLRGSSSSFAGSSKAFREEARAEASFGSSSLFSFSSLLAATAFAVGYRQATSSVAREAAAKKKKGVRVVDGKEIPWMLYGPKTPLKVKVVSNHKQPQTLTQPTGDPNWETCHITFEHEGKFPYLEGQSLGVIPPGPDKKGETPGKLRLYSITSSAVGDDEASTTVSLCVKRLVEVNGKFSNRELGEDKPDKAGTAFPDQKVYRGVSSNYVCDLNPGDEVTITGPTGAEMLLPDDPSANLVMMATGTGIAPMRSFLRYLFHDKAGANPDGTRKFKGTAWLFLGVPYSKSIIYDDEHQEYKAQYPEQFRYDYAVSREDKNAAGEKMYIQTKMAQYGEELWELFQKPKTHIYMCGLKGMEKGIKAGFGPISEKHGVDWTDFVKDLKKQHRYHVEVY